MGRERGINTSNGTNGSSGMGKRQEETIVAMGTVEWKERDDLFLIPWFQLNKS